MTDAIVLDRVSKMYGGQTVLADTSLSIAKGCFVALVGGSGAGKTTLLKLMNGLSTPTSGRVLLDGADVVGRPGPELRRGIGYVFQEVGLFPHLTVAENIGITPTLLGWAAAEIAARTAELLDLVALPRDVASRRRRRPVRRPAPAGGRGPGPGGAAVDPADGRAVRGAGLR
jgi:osmoprotectant transport system ATP-binding protein